MSALPLYSFYDYEKEAKKTAIYPGRGTWIGIVYAALGLGEAGELQGKAKKMIRDDFFVLTDEKREAMIDELGDVLWYASALASELGVSLSQVAQRNVQKLQSRQERGVLQGSGDER